MQGDIEIGCVCGEFRATLSEISPRRANRVVCCCQHCQEYAHLLGRGDDILDEHGGTDVAQVSPARLHFIQGEEHLRCLQLTDKGAYRWYTGCCHTPIVHTLPSYSVPFMAVNHLCVKKASLHGDYEDYVGPVRVRVNGKFSGELKKKLKATAWDLLKMLFHYAPKILWWSIKGEHKRSPFYNHKTKLPLLPPQRTIDSQLESGSN